MSWPKPEFSKSQIDRAGTILLDTVRRITSRAEVEDYKDFLWAYRVVENWRWCHGYPIKPFQVTLRSKLRPIERDAIVAQRLS